MQNTINTSNTGKQKKRFRNILKLKYINFKYLKIIEQVQYKDIECFENLSWKIRYLLF